MDDNSEWYVYDKSFPAYYYPAVIFLNSPEYTDPTPYLKATTLAFKTYVSLDSDLNQFELDLAVKTMGGVSDEEIFTAILSYLEGWSLGNDSVTAAPKWAVDKILMMGVIAPF